LLARLGVNSLVTAPRLQLRQEGRVTMARFGSMSSKWNDLYLRRAALFILAGISRSLEWVSFQKNDADLWRHINDQLHYFFVDLRDNGRLLATAGADSIFVKCDADTNANLINRQGDVAFIIGFVLPGANDFLAFRFLYREGDCTVKELGWQPGLALAS
jgi:phage tail sheath protein FI